MQRGAVTCNAVSEGASDNSRSVARQRVNRQKPPIVSSPMTTTMDLITWPLEDCQEHVIKVDKVSTKQVTIKYRDKGQLTMTSQIAAFLFYL